MNEKSGSHIMHPIQNNAFTPVHVARSLNVNIDYTCFLPLSKTLKEFSLDTLKHNYTKILSV